MAVQVGRFQLFAIGIDKVTMAEAVSRCLAFIASGRPHMVVTPNAEIAYAAADNPALAELINKADLVIPDGAGVVLASRILGDPVPEKVAGTDLATNLLAELNKTGGRVFLLGTKPDVVAKAAANLRATYPGLGAVEYHHGFWKPEDEPALIQQIRSARPDVLYVALGSPRQEQWIRAHQAAVGAPLAIGVGGTIDVWAGVAQRAPEWMIKRNLEWLFRVVKFGRYGRSLPPLMKFVGKVARLRLLRR
ncbi:MAG TPA: WecB/TagA/CpsF family glycosyltransferase [Symbiobacteriaceae bacterium]|nr:WecB/TagA/CpsF family glycosyltransferase [Symbiobacteriaceae bacterium]